MITETITPLPPGPSPEDPENFATVGHTFLNALEDTPEEMNTAFAQANALSVTMNGYAAAADAAKNLAEASASMAAALVNFQGVWNTLSGQAASKGDSVYHSVAGTTGYWALASDLAEISDYEPGADSEWIEINLLSSIDEILRPISANILLLAFRLAIYSGISVQSMIDGFVDEYEDETGVDASSSNQYYNSTGDFYINWDVDPDYANDGGTGDRTSSIEITYTGTWATPPSTVLVNGSTSTGAGFINPSIGASFTVDFGSGARKKIDEVKIYASDVSSANWIVYGSNDNSEFSVIMPSFGFSTSTSGASNSVTNHSAYRYYKFELLTGSHSTVNIYELEFNIDDVTVSDMELISEAETALHEPDDVFVVLLHEKVDSCTLNTDTLVWASRDGGTTRTQVPLTQEDVDGSMQVLSGSADISAQPSGTDMVLIITTDNDKEQIVHGAAMQWS